MRAGAGRGLVTAFTLPNPVRPEPVRTFHLPGKHDQKTHSGGVGLSPATEKEVAREEDKAGVAFISSGQDVNDTSVRQAAKAKVVGALTDRLVADPKAVTALKDYRKRIGDTLSDDPAELRKNMATEVNQVVQGWAHTSGDTDTYALGRQLAIKEEFGLKSSDPFINLKGDPLVVRGLITGRYKERGELDRRIVRTMYNHTQAELKKAGIKEVVLRRGLTNIPAPSLPDNIRNSVLKQGSWEGTRIVGVGQPASSWSANRQTARSFSANPMAGTRSIVLTAKVPASRILSTARTGFGALSEQEFVVLDSPGKVHARVSRTP